MVFAREVAHLGHQTNPKVNEQDNKELFSEISQDLKKIVCLLETVPGPDRDDPKNWWSPEETMKYLGVCVKTLYNLRKDDELEAIRKRGRLRYFAPSAVRLRDYYLK